MREIEVGLRYDLQNPPAFFGLDEVNALIREGATVTAVQPGRVLAKKLGATAETTRLTISGFALKVQLRERGDQPE